MNVVSNIFWVLSTFFQIKILFLFIFRNLLKINYLKQKNKLFPSNNIHFNPIKIKKSPIFINKNPQIRLILKIINILSKIQIS